MTNDGGFAAMTDDESARPRRHLSLIINAAPAAKSFVIAPQ